MKKKALILSLFLFFGLPAASAFAQSDDWPVFQHDSQHSGYNSNEILLKPPLTKLWQISLGSATQSTGMVESNGILFVKTEDGNLYAINVSNGNTLWSVQTNYSQNSIEVAVGNGMVYTGGVNTNLSENDAGYYTVNAYNVSNGQLVWSTPTLDSNNVDQIRGIAYDNNNVLFTRGNGIQVLDSTTGNTIWQQSTANTTTFMTPGVSNGIVYVAANANGEYYAFNESTGATIWQQNTFYGGWFSSPTIVNNVLFDPGYDSYQMDAWNASNGSTIWSDNIYPNGYTGATAVVANGIVSDIWQNGMVYAWDASSGSQDWTFSTGATDNGESASPIGANGIEYIPSDTGVLYALNMQTGQTVWQYADSAAVTGAIVADNRLFFSDSNGSIYAFQNQTYSITGTVFTDSNHDGVQDNSEQGYPNVTVTISKNNQTVATITTGNNGTYFLPSLEAGTYSVAVILPTGYTSTTTNPVSVDLTANTTENFGIIPNPPSVRSINVTPSPVIKNSSMTSTASFISYDPADTASWNWGDGHTTNGTVTESNDSGSVTNTHTYTALGSYTQTLTVTANIGLAGISQTVIAVAPSGGFKGGNLSGINYSGANLSNQNISSGDLQNTIFNNANLTDANFISDNAQGASFDGANLTGANLTSADFQDVNFTSANLTDADLKGDNVQGSNMTDSNLTGANLSGGDFQNINFTSANLTGATLNNSNLKGSIMTGVIYSNTICPNGSNSNNDGNTCTGQGGYL